MEFPDAFDCPFDRLFHPTIRRNHVHPAVTVLKSPGRLMVNDFATRFGALRVVALATSAPAPTNGVITRATQVRTPRNREACIVRLLILFMTGPIPVRRLA